MKFKVCTCWDDGVLEDERLVGIFRKHGAKATFNLNPGLMGETRGTPSWISPGDEGWSCRGYRTAKLSLKDIPEVYAGFELASHCWRHENADSMPASEWIRTALDARHFLEDVAQKPCTGFAWPCGVTTPETVAALREAGFTYGRTTKYAADFLAENPEPMALKSSCHFLDTRAFWSRYAAAKKNGGVFYFWGHAYETMQHERLWKLVEDAVAYISADPEAEWVTVAEAAKLLPAAQRGNRRRTGIVT